MRSIGYIAYVNSREYMDFVSMNKNIVLSHADLE